MAASSTNSPCIVNLIAALTPSQTSPSTPALPVAAIQSLLSLISHSTSKTMRGLVEEIEGACHEMERWGREDEEGQKIMRGRSWIPLRSGCELFLRYISRVNVEEEVSTQGTALRRRPPSPPTERG